MNTSLVLRGFSLKPNQKHLPTHESFPDDLNAIKPFRVVYLRFLSKDESETFHFEPEKPINISCGSPGIKLMNKTCRNL